jgi:cation:H+ antiporter
MNVLLIWGKFFILLLLIFIFGTKASKNADVIAKKKGWAKAFMGVVFIAMITSFPELFTGISAVTVVKSPDIALGEILGSCIFNLLIIAIIELSFRKKEMYRLQGKINILPMGFSLILIALLTLGLTLKLKFSILSVGLFPLLIFILYFVFMKIIYSERNEEKQETGSPLEIVQAKKIKSDSAEKASIKKEVISFTICALVIIAVGWYLPKVGEELATAMGWNHSFVGIVFLAFVTSFPELTVSFAAVRMGSIDMFIGNIAGSNLFNLAIVFFIDIFYIKGSVLSSVSANNIPTGIIAILMNFIIFFAVVRRSSYKFFNIISINAVFIIILYILTLVIIY